MNVEKFEQDPMQASERLRSMKERVFEDMEKYDELAGFINELKTRYPDFQDYFMYHFFSGSTPGKECSKTDFPNEDSIEKFVDELLEG